MAREAKLIAATGVKRVGKTYATMVMVRQAEVGVPSKQVPPRRGLIIDINDEYDEFHVKAIDIDDIVIFMSHPIVELRRVRPFYTKGPNKGQRIKKEEMLTILGRILDVFKGGVMVIEDINKYTGDAISLDLSSAITTNAHMSCDLILHFQSVGRILPKMWQNINMVRYHHQNDPIWKSKNKLPDFVLFSLAEQLVDTEYFAGNTRFYVWIDNDNKKLIGNFTQEKFRLAIAEFISTNISEIKYLTTKRNEIGKPVYTYPGAVQAHSDKLFNLYWGNPI
jgi:hypothetical protein